MILQRKRQHLWRAVGAYAERFLRRIGEAPAFCIDRGTNDAKVFDVGESPATISDLLLIIDEHIDRPGINPTSGRFMGYIPGGGLFPAALGDYLAAVANRYAGYSFAAPGAVRLENALLAWMAQVVGFPASARGNLTSGGSLAHLIALVVARQWRGASRPIGFRGLSFMPVTNFIIACRKRFTFADWEPAHSGWSPRINISAWIQGDFTRGIARPGGRSESLASDGVGRNRQFRLDRSSRSDWTPGARARAVVPRRRCLRGVFFALRVRTRTTAGNRASRFDRHRPPQDTLLALRDWGGAGQRRSASGPFVSSPIPITFQDGEAHKLDVSPADLSPELTKHFRGLRVWLPLKLFGVGPFRAALEEKMLLASYFHERIQDVSGFRVGPPPTWPSRPLGFSPRRATRTNSTGV